MNIDTSIHKLTQEEMSKSKAQNEVTGEHLAFLDVLWWLANFPVFQGPIVPLSKKIRKQIIQLDAEEVFSFKRFDIEDVLAVINQLTQTHVYALACKNFPFKFDLYNLPVDLSPFGGLGADKELSRKAAVFLSKHYNSRGELKEALDQKEWRKQYSDRRKRERREPESAFFHYWLKKPTKSEPVQ